MILLDSIENRMPPTWIPCDRTGLDRMETHPLNAPNLDSNRMPFSPSFTHITREVKIATGYQIRLGQETRERTET